MTRLREKPFQTLATYTDKNGTQQAVLVNAGDYISLTVNGVEFRGDNFGELEAVQSKEAALAKGLEVNDWGELVNFDIKYDQAVTLIHNGATLIKKLKFQGHIYYQEYRGEPSFELELNDEAGAFARGTSNKVEDSFEAAMDRLRYDLPEGVIFYGCAGCALSDYSPYSGPTDGGKLVCFRADKDRYRILSTTKQRPNKQSVFGMYYSDHPKYSQVQEVDVCDEFEPRKPNTGYRG